MRTANCRPVLWRTWCMRDWASASIRAASNARWRVKKNDEEPPHAIAMSENGKDVYEALRADVICGTACARRMGAIVFHGLWRGLAVLITPEQAPIARQQSAPRPKTTSVVAHDRQLVHMLANMVLAAETGGSHVY